MRGTSLLKTSDLVIILKTSNFPQTQFALLKRGELEDLKYNPIIAVKIAVVQVLYLALDFLLFNYERILKISRKTILFQKV